VVEDRARDHHRGRVPWSLATRRTSQAGLTVNSPRAREIWLRYSSRRAV
jgi:hypothetical protein